ncbi:MAG TPA: 1-deoxy-D-xylulose-5-phosphate synthase [bacterium]|nr:1-deoxy-D-xylulose-5-phosphate synthase [bacterium]HNT65224.1 1-deoxy-D-xylulose-5-phosphate synthase [bacterium]HOX86973.1 1-deoxy-D-xylulose-5-phosphate synthase [bacterium]HPG46304.1 1-deoxy-D-xylulose-5-phosphate synthase [bacterium]HPM98502.1 1-deoxy-D-xylulose-5-phosphate synthase [bacterium]
MQQILSRLNDQSDIKKLTIPEMVLLVRELRETIVDTLSHTGGHLAPSLGVVELTVALHYIFSTPEDKIIWDVGHQAYAHKILTGRRDAFKTIRQPGGISGFPKISESPHDAFGVGHASTAISAALGIATARDLAGEKYHVVAVVGDGALTGGLAYEGLNNLGASGKNVVVILNDNSMSISPNVGAMAKYLTNLISNPLYNRVKSEIWNFTGNLDRFGERIRWAAQRLEESLKSIIMPGQLFERLGLRYFGPIDGHNLSELLHVFREVKNLQGPILVHMLTKKGKGFKPAEDNSAIFHGLGKFDPATGKVVKESTIPSFTQVFGQTVVELAAENPKLVAITAAMAIGTGLSAFSTAYPERFFDVGIAEGHAVTFAAGLSSQGYLPIVAIYSTFLQRAYDEVIHDVALQRLPVIFALDRAGLVGDDGPTHHGVFDLAYMRHIPNLIAMVPKDEDELRHMLFTAVQTGNGPIAIRYPRGEAIGVPLSSPLQSLEIGKAEILQPGTQICLLALGPLVYTALDAAAEIKRRFGITIQVVNARFLKPFDKELLLHLCDDFHCLITLEEGVLAGGFGSAVAEFLADHHCEPLELIRLGIPDRFIDQGDRDSLLDGIGLSAPAIVRTIEKSNTLRKLAEFNDFMPLGTESKTV